ncbi:MAG: hypothetical protein ACRDKL_08435 [Solirubrobacteraceae bacterium]
MGRRVLLASELIAVHAVVVDAIDETSATVDAKHGFEPLTASPLRLQMPLGEMRANVT